MKIIMLWLLNAIVFTHSMSVFAVESTDKRELDLTTYTCEQFIAHVDKQNQIAMIATVWANGYRMGVLGLDEMPLLSPKAVETDIYGLQNLCSEHPQATFVKTLQEILWKQLDDKKQQQ